MSDEEISHEEKKRTIGKLLNEILGLNIEWERLTLDDLIELAKLFAEPERVIARIKKAQKRTKEAINNLKQLAKDLLKSVFKYWNGPVIRVLKRIVLEAEAEKSESEDEED